MGLIDRRQGYFLSLSGQKDGDQDQRHRNDGKSEFCHCFNPLFLCFCADCAKPTGEMCEPLHTSMTDYLDGNEKGGHTGGGRRTLQTQAVIGQTADEDSRVEDRYSKLWRQRAAPLRSSRPLWKREERANCAIVGADMARASSRRDPPTASSSWILDRTSELSLYEGVL